MFELAPGALISFSEGANSKGCLFPFFFQISASILHSLYFKRSPIVTLNSKIGTYQKFVCVLNNIFTLQSNVLLSYCHKVPVILLPLTRYS